MNTDDAGRKGNGMIWVAAGCGALLLLTLCAGLGGAFFMYAGVRAPGPDDRANPDQAYPAQPSGPSTGPMMPSNPGTSPGATDSVEVNATVTVVTGSRPVPENAICSFRVERHERSQGRYWCRTQAVCGGRLLFGGATAGYFPCTFSGGASPSITGGDPDTTSSDNDASFAIDTNDSRVIIRDDASGPNGQYSLIAHIDSLR